MIVLTGADGDEVAADDLEPAAVVAGYGDDDEEDEESESLPQPESVSVADPLAGGVMLLDPAADSAEIAAEFNLTDRAARHPEAVKSLENVQVSPVRRKKSTPVGKLIGIVLGPIVALPLAGGILLFLGKAPDLGFFPFDGSFNSAKSPTSAAQLPDDPPRQRDRPQSPPDHSQSLNQSSESDAFMEDASTADGSEPNQPTSSTPQTSIVDPQADAQDNGADASEQDEYVVAAETPTPDPSVGETPSPGEVVKDATNSDSPPLEAPDASSVVAPESSVDDVASSALEDDDVDDLMAAGPAVGEPQMATHEGVPTESAVLEIPPSDSVVSQATQDAGSPAIAVPPTAPAVDSTDGTEPSTIAEANTPATAEIPDTAPETPRTYAARRVASSEELQKAGQAALNYLGKMRDLPVTSPRYKQGLAYTYKRISVFADLVDQDSGAIADEVLTAVVDSGLASKFAQAAPIWLRSPKQRVEGNEPIDGILVIGRLNDSGNGSRLQFSDSEESAPLKIQDDAQLERGQQVIGFGRITEGDSEPTIELMIGRSLD
ncbi:MAG: hypothetical protein AAGA03_09225 [Planctomycetota bacterium]